MLNISLKFVLFILMSYSFVYAGLFDPPAEIIHIEKDPILSQWRNSIENPSYWQKAPESPFVIDDFEDQNYSELPRWWAFEKMAISIIENDKEYKRIYQLGDFSLSIEGRTSKWLVGGIGTYLAFDGTLFDTIELVVKGNPLKPVRIEIELYDDDNLNWEIENSKLIYTPDFDDRFAYMLDVASPQWQRIQIPLSEFKDHNPKIGDDTWNPNQLERSGGLLQMQLVIYGLKKRSDVEVRIDSISFLKLNKEAEESVPIIETPDDNEPVDETPKSEDSSEDTES